MALGYKIIYDAHIKDGSCRRRNNPDLRRRILTGLFMLLLICAFIEPVREKVVKFFIPGDAAVTHDALQVMSECIREGASLVDAVSAFCQEIVIGAQQSVS